MLDLTGESRLNRLRDYKNHWRLDDDDEKALIALCLALNPVELDGSMIRTLAYIIIVCL